MAHDVSLPVAGFYRYRLSGGAVRGAVRIYYGPPRDPVTGEELDRSWRWMAELNGEPVGDFDRVWPVCIGAPIAESLYRRYCRRLVWARSHASDSAYADPAKKYDPLSINNPLPI